MQPFSIILIFKYNLLYHRPRNPAPHTYINPSRGACLKRQAPALDHLYSFVAERTRLKRRVCHGCRVHIKASCIPQKSYARRRGRPGGYKIVNKYDVLTVKRGLFCLSGQRKKSADVDIAFLCRQSLLIRRASAPPEKRDAFKLHAVGKSARKHTRLIVSLDQYLIRVARDKCDDKLRTLNAPVAKQLFKRPGKHTCQKCGALAVADMLHPVDHAVERAVRL